MRLLQLCRLITLCANLQLKWGLKQSCNPCQEFCKGMWHFTYKQGNQGNSRLLIEGNQIDNLTFGPSFDHNLCFKYRNGSCEPILDMSILRAFQLHKEFFNPMSFDPCNHPLKFLKSMRTPIPKVGAHLVVWGSFLHTLLHS